MAVEHETFGQRLGRLRRAAGMTQRQLAARAGVSAGAIRHWEQGVGEPALCTVVAVAGAIGCTIDHLVGHVGTARADQ